MSEIANLPYDNSMYIPRFWLSAHKPIGEKFKVPGDDQVYFVAMKSPLSKKLNDMFPEKNRWGVKEVIDKVTEDIGQGDIQNWIFVAIELSDKVKPPKSDWDELRIQNHYCPIKHDYTTEAVNNFINFIKPDLNTSFKYLYLVSCNNGHDRVGVAISMYLMQNYDMRIVDAYNLFKKSRWPGFYSQKAAEFLTKFKTKDEKKKILEAQRNDEFEILNLDSDTSRDSRLKVQRLPNFSHFSGDPIKRDVIITNYNEALNKFTPKEIYQHSETDSPRPIIEYLSLQDNQQGEEKLSNILTPNECLELVRTHAYRSSFVPYGDFVYILALDPTFLVINYGNDKYWRIPGRVETDVPVILTAYAVETSTRIDLYATDLLAWKGESYQKVELDKRLYTLYNAILPKLHISHVADIKFNIRPLGRMTSLVKLSDYLLSSPFKSKYDFIPRGICFLKRKPPGRTIFVPFFAHVHLYFVMNATDIAVLYARSDDNTALVPCYCFKFEAKDHYGGLDKKVVRFNVGVPAGKRWEPVAICKHELPDYISVVNIMKSLKIDQNDTNDVLKMIEYAVKDEAKKAAKK